MTKTLKKSDPVEPEVIDPQAVDNEDAPIDKGAIPDKDLEKHMTQRQILFCKYYVSDQEVFCNGTQSYAKAYGYDLELEPEKYKACQGSASVLLSNHIISRYINKLLTNIIPDEGIDKLLTQLALQNVNPKIKIEALKELNKLRGRIIERTKDLTKENPFEDLATKVKK